MSGVNKYLTGRVFGSFDDTVDPDTDIVSALADAVGGGEGAPNILQSLSAAANGPLGAGFLVSAFGGIMKGLFGGTGTKDVKRAERGLAAEYDKDIFNPAKAAGMASRGVLRQGRGMANVLARRFGPEAKGEIYSKQLGTIADIYGDAFIRNATGKSARNLSIKQMLLDSAHKRRM